MADDLLAKPADAERFGKTVSEAALATAAARARRFTRQHISTKTQLIMAVGPMVQLPGRPVQSVTSVTDAGGNDIPFELQPGGRLSVECSGIVDIIYTSGWETLPDHVLELIVTIAARLEGINPALAGGLQQATGGSESMGFGWDSHQGVGGLVASEKQGLRDLFPRRPRLIVGRP